MRPIDIETTILCLGWKPDVRVPTKPMSAGIATAQPLPPEAAKVVRILQQWYNWIIHVSILVGTARFRVSNRGVHGVETALHTYSPPSNATYAQAREFR